MSFIRRAVVAVAAAGLAVGGALPVGSGAQEIVVAPAERAVPTLGPGLDAAVAGLAPGELLEVIVSAHTFDGLDAIDHLGISARRLRSTPVALARVDLTQLNRLVGEPSIRSIWPRESYDLHLDDATQIVGADRVEQALGITGEGVAVAVLDTGIDATHPDLPWHDKVVANYEVAANPFDAGASLLVDMPNTDDDSHGTHVASTIAGNDADGGHVHDGVAPGAQLYGYSINVSLTIDNARSLVAIDDVIQKRLAGVPIVAISNSWGGGPGEHNPDDPLSILVKAAFDADIAVLFSAGNAGQEAGELDTASDQCTMPWVVCVGATTDPGQLVQFSSRGRPPVATHVVMPDGFEYDVPAGNHDRALAQALDIGVFRPTVSAPGVNIVAACAASAGDACDAPGGYHSLSGTSMSTPHVSGVVALVHASRLDALGTLDLTASQVIATLESTATPMPGWQMWEAGAGLVDAYKAATAVRSQTPALTPPNFGATPRPLGTPTVAAFSGEAGPAGTVTRQLIGEHVVAVPAGTDRLDLRLTWNVPAENLYMYAWQPGADPDGADADGADQESWGLLEGLAPRLNTFRNGTIASPEPGDWIVRVVGRLNTVTSYTLTAAASPAERPQVAVASAEVRDGSIRFQGTSTFPPAPGTGVTRAAVAGTDLPVSNPGTPTTFWLHGEVPEAEKYLEDPSLGVGPTFDGTPPADPLPSMQTGAWYGDDASGANALLAYWRGQFEGDIRGDVPISVWLSGPTLSLGGQVTFTLFDMPRNGYGTDDVTIIARTTVSGAGIAPVPTKVDTLLEDVVYTVRPDRDVVLQLSTMYVDVGYFQAWYDSTEFASSLTLPIASASSVAGPATPTDVTATALTGGRTTLRWAAVPDATDYVVYRSSSPVDLGSPVATVTGTTYTDNVRTDAQSAYYRVAARTGVLASSPSQVVVGTTVTARRWVEVRAGRGPWETASSMGAKRWRATVAPATGPAAVTNTYTVRAQDHGGASVEVVQVPTP